MQVRTIEGVDYYPFAVRFTRPDNRSVRWVRWAPALFYLVGAVKREIDDDEVKPGTHVHIRPL